MAPRAWEGVAPTGPVVAEAAVPKVWAEEMVVSKDRVVEGVAPMGRAGEVAVAAVTAGLNFYHLCKWLRCQKGYSNVDL